MLVDLFSFDFIVGVEKFLINFFLFLHLFFIEPQIMISEPLF